MTETRLQYITGKTGGAISAVESQINTILKYSITSNELIDLERPITNSHPHTNIITIDRPDSSQLVDLHVYVLARTTWKDRQNFAYNEAMDEAISSGFVRVPSHLSLFNLREQLEIQIGGDENFPREYIFLRSVGRAMTRVKRKQEYDLKVKNFRPPQTFAPEIFLLEGKYEDFNTPDTPNSSVSVNNVTASRQPLGPISRSRVDTSILSEKLRKLYEEQDRLKKRQNELERLRLQAERQLEEERKRKLEELERARLLERQLREQREHERELAAIKIQSSYRGYRDRKSVQELKRQRHEELRKHEIETIPEDYYPPIEPPYNIDINNNGTNMETNEDKNMTNHDDQKTVTESDYNNLIDLSIREFRKQTRTPSGKNLKDILGDDMDRETLSSSANYYKRDELKIAEIQNEELNKKSLENEEDDDYQNVKTESEDYVLPYQHKSELRKLPSATSMLRNQSQLNLHSNSLTRASVVHNKNEENNEEELSERSLKNPFENLKPVLVRPNTNHESKKRPNSVIKRNNSANDLESQPEEPNDLIKKLESRLLDSSLSSSRLVESKTRLTSAKIPLNQDKIASIIKMSSANFQNDQLDMIDEQNYQNLQDNPIKLLQKPTMELTDHGILLKKTPSNHSIDLMTRQKSSLVDIRRNSNPLLLKPPSAKQKSFIHSSRPPSSHVAYKETQERFQPSFNENPRKSARLVSARRGFMDERAKFEPVAKGFSNNFAKSYEVIEEDYRSVTESVQEERTMEFKPPMAYSQLSTTRSRNPYVSSRTKDFPTPEVISTNTSRIQLETRTSLFTYSEAARATIEEHNRVDELSSESLQSDDDDDNENGVEDEDENDNSSSDYDDIYILTDSQIDDEWEKFLTKNSKTNFNQILNDLQEKNREAEQIEIKRAILRLSKDFQIKLAENNLTKDKNIIIPKQLETLVVKPIITPRSQPQHQSKPIENSFPYNTSINRPSNNESSTIKATNSFLNNNSNLSYSYDTDYQMNIKKIETNSILSGSEEQSQDYYQVANQIYEDEINLNTNQIEQYEEPLFTNRNIEFEPENYEEEPLQHESPKSHQINPIPLIKTRKNEPLNLHNKQQALNEEVINDNDGSIEELKKRLQQIKASRLDLEGSREELIRKLKLIHNRISIRRKEAKDLWKKKYFAEKKNTPPLEEKVKAQLNEIETLQKKIYLTIEHDGRNSNDSAHVNQKLVSLKLQQEIDMLKRQVEQVKLRLTTDIKLRNQAEAESKALRTELSQTKANLNHIKNKALIANFEQYDN